MLITLAVYLGAATAQLGSRALSQWVAGGLLRNLPSWLDDGVPRTGEPQAAARKPWRQQGSPPHVGVAWISKAVRTWSEAKYFSGGQGGQILPWCPRTGDLERFLIYFSPVLPPEGTAPFSARGSISQQQQGGCLLEKFDVLFLPRPPIPAFQPLGWTSSPVWEEESTWRSFAEAKEKAAGCHFAWLGRASDMARS